MEEVVEKKSLKSVIGVKRVSDSKKLPLMKNKNNDRHRMDPCGTLEKGAKEQGCRDAQSMSTK